MKINLKDKTQVILLGVIIITVLFSFTMIKIIKDNSQCTANPFTYGAEQLVKEEMPSFCSCTPDDTSKFIPFYFDEEDIYLDHPLLPPRDSTYEEINLFYSPINEGEIKE